MLPQARQAVCNVLIGFGAAGSRAAVATREEGLDVAVVGKRGRRDVEGWTDRAHALDLRACLLAAEATLLPREGRGPGGPAGLRP